MTLILKLDLDMVKMYYHTKNEGSVSPASKVVGQTDTDIQTYRQTDRHTHTHTQTDRHYVIVDVIIDLQLNMFHLHPGPTYRNTVQEDERGPISQTSADKNLKLIVGDIASDADTSIIHIDRFVFPYHV